MYYSKEGSCGNDYRGKASIIATGSDCDDMQGTAQYSGSEWGDCTLDVCLLSKPSITSYAAAQVCRLQHKGKGIGFTSAN